MTSLTRPLVVPIDLRTGSGLLSRLLHSENSLTFAMLRLTLALVLLPHGLQHMFSLFGGYGFTATLGWMTGTLGIPAPLAAAGIVLEVAAPALLIAGLGSRLWGAALAVFMATAASTHVPNGFFMNWFGTLPAGSEGFEYHLLAIVLAIAIAVNGGGALSLDRILAARTANAQ